MLNQIIAIIVKHVCSFWKCAPPFLSMAPIKESPLMMMMIIIKTTLQLFHSHQYN